MKPDKLLLLLLLLLLQLLLLTSEKKFVSCFCRCFACMPTKSNFLVLCVCVCHTFVSVCVGFNACYFKVCVGGSKVVQMAFSGKIFIPSWLSVFYTLHLKKEKKSIDKIPFVGWKFRWDERERKNSMALRITKFSAAFIALHLDDHH